MNKHLALAEATLSTKAKKAAKEKKSDKKKKVDSMHIKRAQGGFIASHQNGMDSQDHVLPTMDALHAHLDQHMGGGEEPEAQDNAAEEAAE